MGSNNKYIGAIGEERAALYLQDMEYNIFERNATSRWGELDIVAIKNNTIYFIEVKTRISTRQGSPYEAVNGMKVRHLTRTIQYYILSHKWQNKKYQLDVISVELNADLTMKDLKHYENILVNGVY